MNTPALSGDRTRTPLIWAGSQKPSWTVTRQGHLSKHGGSSGFSAFYLRPRVSTGSNRRDPWVSPCP
ncbi:uncharacterized protein METZ01_LOCUS120452 [marine metagenome]|uniref:Uncharacterized protein n=1 Tax=marine metagenome TaxID=408172 RepID=A0A381XS94_9ZZZZ